ncbi:MAG: DUF433 domain-containing protein [Mycobacteriales bacterium]
MDGNDGGRHNDVVTGSDLLELVSSDPATCHGQPCIKGTRVLVTVILDALAAGLASDARRSGAPVLHVRVSPRLSGRDKGSDLWTAHHRSSRLPILTPWTTVST